MKIPELAHVSSSSGPWQSFAGSVAARTRTAKHAVLVKDINDDAAYHQFARSSRGAATRLVQFVNASPTPFHAVHNAAIRLDRKAGFARRYASAHHIALPVFSASVD